MNKHLHLVVLLSACITFGCQPSTPQKKIADKNLTNNIKPLNDQANLVQWVKENEIVDKERSLVHVSHTCTLTINNQHFAVVDIRELVKSANSPRGVNQIILLNSENQLVNRIEYGNARPLFCEGNKLYLYGDIIPDGQTNEGNVLEFSDEGFSFTVNKNLL